MALPPISSVRGVYQSPHARTTGWRRSEIPPRRLNSLLCHGRQIDLGPVPQETLRHLVHPGLGDIPDLLGDLHRAEFRPAHRAEMRDLGTFGRERLVVELLGGSRVEGQIELVAPAEFEAGAAQRVVAKLGGRM